MFDSVKGTGAVSSKWSRDLELSANPFPTIVEIDSIQIDNASSQILIMTKTRSSQEKVPHDHDDQQPRRTQQQRPQQQRRLQRRQLLWGRSEAADSRQFQPPLVKRGTRRIRRPTQPPREKQDDPQEKPLQTPRGDTRQPDGYTQFFRQEPRATHQHADDDPSPLPAHFVGMKKVKKKNSNRSNKNFRQIWRLTRIIADGNRRKREKKNYSQPRMWSGWALASKRLTRNCGWKRLARFFFFRESKQAVRFSFNVIDNRNNTCENCD
jgi:hypothetical protein